MLDVPAFITEKNKRWGDAFVLLYEFEYAPGEFFRCAWLGLTETSITFEGQTWQRFPIDRPTRSQNARAQIPTFDLNIANPERVFQSIIQQNILEGRPGRLITVHRDHLGDSTAKIEEWFTVELASASASVITLTCKSIRFNPRRARIPSKTMTRAEYPGLLGANRRRFY